MEKIIIMGAAGRDFHNFNIFFRNNRKYKVVAFTAAQIPDISGRRYPPKLAGKLYPKGIPVFPEEQLAALIKKHGIDFVYFCYSDVSHENLMHKASLVLAAGANFALLGTNDTCIKSAKPVISVCAVRTGAGKSPASRMIVSILRKMGKRVAVIRHPMPYGNLVEQEAQRFASFADLSKNKCTIEEREEYEPHLLKGAIVYAGIDYEKILRMAEKEADVILWDGGNNDFPFYQSDLKIVIADPHRAGHEIRYHPGEANIRMADVVIINKVNTAKKENVNIVMNNIKKYNPQARIIKAALDIIPAQKVSIKNRRVLVLEDGPTLTHGEMKYGAASIYAKKEGAIIIEAEKHAVGSIKDVYKKYSHLKRILPAMGYGKKQIKELEATINRAECDYVIDGTPADMSKIMKINKKIIEVDYELRQVSGPSLEALVQNAVTRKK